jgi:formate dehydrogenase maturation protein FdhE
MKRKSGIIVCPYCGVKGKVKVTIFKMGERRRIKRESCPACGWGIRDKYYEI